MTSPLERCRNLIARATNPQAPLEEARSCAMIACRLIVEHGLLGQFEQAARPAPAAPPAPPAPRPAPPPPPPRPSIIYPMMGLDLLRYLGLDVEELSPGTFVVNHRRGRSEEPPEETQAPAKKRTRKRTG